MLEQLSSTELADRDSVSLAAGGKLGVYSRGEGLGHAKADDDFTVFTLGCRGGFHGDERGVTDAEQPWECRQIFSSRTAPHPCARHAPTSLGVPRINIGTARLPTGLLEGMAYLQNLLWILPADPQELPAVVLGDAIAQSVALALPLGLVAQAGVHLDEELHAGKGKVEAEAIEVKICLVAHPDELEGLLNVSSACGVRLGVA